MEQASNLQQDGLMASRQVTPILLLVSRDHCPYCRLMKREILHPMQLGENGSDRVIMREIVIDQSQNITNFQGQRQSTADFSRGYGASFTPTLLFLDQQGKELTERIVGINTPEMFNFYLDAAIDEASKEIQSRAGGKFRSH